MTKPVTIPNTFATATTAIPLSNLDADFSTVATAMNDANTYSNYAADTGSANAYVVTLTGISAIYSAGLRIQFKAGNANTTASTLNVNAQGAKNITYQDASAIASGTIAANSIVDVMYDGTQFLLMNDPAGGTGGDVVGPASATDNAVVRFDGTTGKLVQNSVVTIADSTGDISGVGQLNATTVDTTNIEVTNIKAKDGTAAASIADSTGVVSITANPVLSGGTANGVLYLNGSKVATSGSALTFDGTALAPDNTTRTLGTSSLRWGTVFATSLADGTDQLIGSSGTTVRVGYGASWTAQSFAIGGTEAMRLTSTGLGIGTSSPAYKLDVSTTSGDTQAAVYDRGSGSSAARLDLRTSGTGASQWYIQTGNTTSGLNGSLRFYDQTNNLERMRLDSSGNLGLGVTPSGWSTSNSVRAVQLPAALLWSYSTTNAYLGQNNYWNGTNRIYYANGYATEYAQEAGVHMWKIAPSGTAGNAITFSQVMTLDANGVLMVGSTTPGSDRVRIKASNTTGSSIYNYLNCTNEIDSDLQIRITGSAATDKRALITTTTNTPIAFGTNDNERARITSGGDLLVGTTTSQDKLTVDGGITIQGAGLDFATSGTKSWQVVGNATDFYIGDQTLTRYAALSTITTFTAWTFVSDKRIKKDILPIQYGLKEILRLNPVKFKFIGEDQPNIGFIAQEIKQIVPEAVSGEEKEFDKNDSPEERARKTLSMSKEMLVPILVKAIQEQQALIESLTSRVAQLEGTQP